MHRLHASCGALQQLCLSARETPEARVADAPGPLRILCHKTLPVGLEGFHRCPYTAKDRSPYTSKHSCLYTSTRPCSQQRGLTALGLAPLQLRSSLCTAAGAWPGSPQLLPRAANTPQSLRAAAAL